MWSTIRFAAARQLRVAGALSATGGAGRLTSRVATKQSALTIPSCYRFQLARRGFAETRGRPPTKKAAATEPAKRGRPAGPKKAAPKKRAKKVLSPEAKKKAEIRQLKQLALLKKPKTLPSRPWLLYFSHHAKEAAAAGHDLASMAKQLGESFKALSTSEVESLRAVAEQNKLANEAAYKAWVESHSPEEIAAANRARRRLRSLLDDDSRPLIKDERQPKRPASGYMFYVKSRWQSGDFAGQRAAEGVSKTIAEEWKSLSETEREPFLTNARLDHERYARETKSVFNRDV